jgi:hypothetical protein
MRLRQDSKKSFCTSPAWHVPQTGTPRAIPRLLITALACTLAPLAVAKLPPPTEEARLAGVEAAAKSAWNDKVGLFQLCNAIDRTATAYRTSAKATGKDVPAAVATPECADPGAYVSPVTPATSKPLEASGAHSPPGLAISPPSTKVPAAEIAKGTKK